MSERTPAQLAADHRKSFPSGVNTRRLALIEKMHAGFTKLERIRPFAAFPGWKEECERRYHANLTDYERAELSLCEQILDEWEAPMWEELKKHPTEQESRIDALLAKYQEPTP